MGFPRAWDGRNVLPESVRQAMAEHIEDDLAVPLLPDVAARVLELSRDEHCDAEKLTRLISYDQSLAAHVLRISNSAAYAPRVPILSIQQAVSRIGLSTLSQVVTAVALKERLFSAPMHPGLVRGMWEHSSATATYASEIAQIRRSDRESAFLCGLLHDVGMPLAVQVACDLERQGLLAELTTDLLEQITLEFHVELGVLLAESWKLGPWVARAVQFHHDPARGNFHPLEVPMVALADQLAYWALDPEREQSDFDVDSALVAAVDLHEGAVPTLLSRRERVRAMVASFS